MSRKAFHKQYDGKLTKIVNLYYVDVEDRQYPSVQSGLVIALEDGRYLAHAQDGPTTPFSEVKELTDDNHTDTNQASEYELKFDPVRNSELWSIVKNVSRYSDSRSENQAIKELNELIRTEKLKLLNEVIHQSTVNLKSAKAVAGWAELRKEQLEAEL